MMARTVRLDLGLLLPHFLFGYRHFCPHYSGLFKCKLVFDVWINALEFLDLVFVKSEEIR